MAIKERKQITGTTAQIKAYEGHEGQIVWDKEKKTFVGMSGTAGKNYPLASQAYVDTQLTEGLESKEDKGVCLPLSGGKLTGVLSLGGGGQLYQHNGTSSSGHGYTILTTKETGSLNSCTLYFANPDSVDKGAMILRYVDGSGNNHDLLMKGETGEIYWDNRTIDTLSTFSGSLVRYASGLQIVFIHASASPDGRTLTFDAPFSSSPIAVANHRGADGTVNITLVCTPTSLVARTNYGSPVEAYIIVIGRWK